MPEIIRNIDIEIDDIMTLRDVYHNVHANSLHIEQTNGKYVVVNPLDENGLVLGSIGVYPQSPQLEINNNVISQNILGFGSLDFPHDARFDYIRRKLWVADTGNHRILKVSEDDLVGNLSISGDMLYPHAMAVNLNTGGVFVKGYSIYDSVGMVCYFSPSGTEEDRFVYNIESVVPGGSSSSQSSISSASSADIISSSSTSSANDVIELPFSNTIVYDHVRSRVWWVAGYRVYMMDERNKEVRVYDLRGDDFYDTRGIDVEISSGNALIVAKDNHDEWFVIQMSRDNNKLMASGYVTSAPVTTTTTTTVAYIDLDQFNGYLTAYWNMDETSGARVDCISSNNFSVVGDVPSNTGKYSNASVLVGGSYNGYLKQTSTSDLTPTNGLAFNAWVYLNSNNSQTIFFKAYQYSPYLIYWPNIEIRTSNSGRWFVALGSTSTQVNSCDYGSEPYGYYIKCMEMTDKPVATLNEWTNITYVVWNSMMWFFVNGQLYGSTAFSTPITTSSLEIDIGAEEPLATGSNSNFRIDEVAFWKDILFSGSSQVMQFASALYNSGSGQRYNCLTGKWVGM